MRMKNWGVDTSLMFGTTAAGSSRGDTSASFRMRLSCSSCWLMSNDTNLRLCPAKIVRFSGCYGCERASVSAASALGPKPGTSGCTANATCKWCTEAWQWPRRHGSKRAHARRPQKRGLERMRRTPAQDSTGQRYANASHPSRPPRRPRLLAEKKILNHESSSSSVCSSLRQAVALGARKVGEDELM